MLTDAAVRKAANSKVPQRLTDGTGRGTGRLLLMTRPPVTAEWYAQVFANGKKRLTKLGNFPALSLAEARQKFRDGDWKAVHDPKGADLATLCRAYCDALRAAGKRSADDVEATLARLTAAIGPKVPANEVTTAMITAALRPVYEAGKASMADHMRCYIRAAFSWALKSEHDYRFETAGRFRLTGNPAALIPAEVKEAGQRWLSEEELSRFWHWLATGGGPKNANRNLSPMAYPVLQLIAATGQRVEEICRLERCMINWKLMVIEWPTTKPGRPHVLPISIQVAEILHRIEPNEHGLYFPAEQGAARPMRDHTLRVLVGRFCELEKVPHFAPRDLRRTFKTLGGFAGLTKTDRDRLQNHHDSTVSGKHYDRYDYLREKRAAMLQWGKWFEARIEKKKPR